MNIAEDFLILRKQVSKDHFSDNELKVLFKENKFDVVNTLMVVEERLTGRVDYRLLETHVERSEVEKKIAELRVIVNEKDAILNAKNPK
jgi:hypothetical protein